MLASILGVRLPAIKLAASRLGRQRVDMGNPGYYVFIIVGLIFALKRVLRTEEAGRMANHR